MIELPPASPRLPLTLGAATLVAIASHHINGEPFRGLLLFAALIPASYIIPWRIPRNRALIWTFRAILYAAILAIVGLPKEQPIYWYIKFEYTDRIGYLLAAELALRFWRKADRARITRDRGDILLLSALLMAFSSNTYDRGPMQWLAPLYTLSLLLSLRTLHPPRDSRATRSALAIMRAAAGLLALSIGFTTIYLITRYDRKLTNWAMSFLRDAATRQSEIGLSSAPRLQTIFNPKPSMTRMILIEGPRGERYLRAMAFHTYDGSRWKPELHEREFKPVSLQDLQKPGSGTRLKVTRLEHTMDLLLLPFESSAISSHDPIERDALASLRATGATHTTYNITLSSASTGPVNLPPDDAQLEDLLDIPREIDPKVITLAKQVAGQGDPATQLARLQLHLRSNHQYSLSFQPEGEPLSDFILNNRAAHCQYFASALVMMARANGIPARFVTGYYAHEPWGDNATVVRDRDAHAWAECWLDNKGWITIDATPSSGRPDAIFPEPGKWRKFWERTTDLPAKVRNWFASLDRPTLLKLAAALTAVVLLFWIIRRLRLRTKHTRTRPRTYDPPSAALLAATKRFDRHLKRHQFPCPPTTTWREHLQTTQTPSLDLQTCLAFINIYDQARFGREQILDQLRQLLKTLEDQH